MHNSNQRDFDLFANHIYIMIVIISIMNANIFKRQYNIVLQPTGRNPKQFS